MELESNVRLSWGTVFAAKPEAPDNYSIAFCNPWDITLNLFVQSGDSGSPLFVFRDGKPVMIGVVRAAYQDAFNFYTFAVQLPVITKFLIGRR